VLAYLFGSLARGTAGPLSDVDVAVLFDRRCDAPGEHGELQDALSRALGSDRIDLVRLDMAPPPLRYRIIRDGRLIMCRDHGVRQGFETATVMQYLDFKPLRDQAFDLMRKAVLEEE